ncbi:RagB/SusD family nutrient uptake outer membrane protein [Sphingobacterium sp.]|uniref:RagB/SusD family nutrient uptake outer membrane protein n=1 Tax=Sphingobacterium sp. TaxID=341027 RepID=UPI0028A58DB8|nr:RagB/SusD family nutrient uptake outer membrane protein [Sphingobacterium sp.]
MERATIYLLAVILLVSCNRDFLEERPNSNIIVPSNEHDFQRLLDNFNTIGHTAALPHLAGDEYFIPKESDWLSSRTAVERNSYVWDADVYGGEGNIEDWNGPYRSIFYANSIIAEIQGSQGSPAKGTLLADTYGQALFHRAKANFDLLKNFSVPFDPNTQKTDLGIPLRTDPSIDHVQERATVEECYGAIFRDLEESLGYLVHQGPVAQRNRATRLAAMAQLCRIYLYRGEYGKAEDFADSVLNRYDRLMDYNTVSTSSNTPFSLTNDELIMYGRTNSYNNSDQLNQKGTVFIDSNLIDLYDRDDLRLSVYFKELGEGRYIMKRGYNGTGLSPFNGLAVDEIMLVKMECLVRRGELGAAAELYNRLRSKRYRKGTYAPSSFTEKEAALRSVLTERRKELVWRGLRWDDIKRLNRQGAGIVLTRSLGGKVYTLLPGSGRYVFNIPQDEINRSGITQNER